MLVYRHEYHYALDLQLLLLFYPHGTDELGNAVVSSVKSPPSSSQGFFYFHEGREGT